ncbi:MAG: ABC transporter permease [Gammaproteobacteria bacterium]
MVKPVFLWTDLLLYVLVAAVVALALYARQREHLRAPWRRVLQDRLGVAALVILSAYLAVGMLDSVHFRLAVEPASSGSAGRYSGQVLSLLDVMLTDLRTHDERTYSAPLATHLFSRETVERPDGREVRIYPRLRYGGAQLADPARDKWPDIEWTALRGAAAAALWWMGVTGLLVMVMAFRRGRAFISMLKAVLGGDTELPWNVALYTLGILMLFASVTGHLAVHYHVFGTDKVGEDVLYQTIKSIRTGLMIGTLTTLVMLPFALVLGIAAGYFRGWVDDVIQYLYTTLNSIPGVLLIAAAILMLEVYMANHPTMFETVIARADLRLLFLCIILGVTSWTGLCRLLRGEALKLRELDYVQAAQAFGVSHPRVLVRHILPNVMHIVLISVVLDFSGLVLAEAVLSYVGVGVDPSTYSWGNMINRARLELAREPVVWWSLLAAFLFMFVLVLSANLFADAVRDAFDPRLRKG